MVTHVTEVLGVSQNIYELQGQRQLGFEVMCYDNVPNFISEK